MTEHDAPVADAPESASEAARSDASLREPEQRSSVPAGGAGRGSIRETAARISELATSGGLSADLVDQARRQRESLTAMIAAASAAQKIEPLPAPRDYQLETMLEQRRLLGQIVEIQRHQAEQAELVANLGQQQDRFTRRVSWAALILAAVSAVVGIVGVRVQVWATLSAK